MKPIVKEEINQILRDWTGHDLYLHLETTTGAYSEKKIGAYIRNGRIQFSRGKIQGEGPYRAGLKINQGWVYAEGLTHWEFDEKKRLLLAGHDEEGRLAVALQLSQHPF